uniref:Uncharacterized protein n=1 Tax=Lotharella oceanica TaxID=641309 RepID=A0A7S2TVK8_9EUKA|mmetsp:Transcript_29036/g.54334  ORF Transcript_29036/g.54334 Transcript_29036/m.54334 type:complete len:131 (+) Transcript_29036:103-495(+)
MPKCLNATAINAGVLEEAEGVIIREIKLAAMEDRLPIYFKRVTVALPSMFSLASHQWREVSEKSDSPVPFLLHFLGMARRYHLEASFVCKSSVGNVAIQQAKQAACAMLDFSRQGVLGRALEYFYYTIGQ